MFLLTQLQFDIKEI